MVDEAGLTDEQSEDAAAAAIETDEQPVYQALAAECQTIAERLGELGVSVNYGGRVNLGDLKPAIEAAAAGEVLVAKGVCTEEEWLFTSMRLLHGLLAGILQQAEEAALQARKPQIAVPRAASKPVAAKQPVHLVRNAR